MTSTTVRRIAMLVAAAALTAPTVVWTAETRAQSPAAALPAMRLVKVRFDPPGADELTNTSLNKEWVQIHNFGEKPWTLTGWSLRDVTGFKFRFPEGFTVQPDATVTIHTGSGKNRPLHLYWGQGAYIWNNTGDKATLKNANRKVVDTCGYDGEGSAVTC
jgi:Lamin Tail Domain